MHKKRDCRIKTDPGCTQQVQMRMQLYAVCSAAPREFGSPFYLNGEVPAFHTAGSERCSRSVVSLLIFTCNINLTFLCHDIRCKIFIISPDFVDQSSVGQELHDTVGSRFDDLVVV